jgi:hypothetical protein
MRKYQVHFYFQGHGLNTKTIECRECTISENAYTFWGGEYGKTNYIVASYPIITTIIKEIVE